MSKSYFFYILVFFCFILAINLVCADENAPYVRSKLFSELKYNPVKKAPALVSGLSNSTLYSEISSIVDELHVLAGDKVNKGDLLIKLNCDDFNYQLMELDAAKEQTLAELSLKKYQLARSQKLFKSNNISEIELKTDQASVKVLQSTLKSIHARILKAKKNINRCEIKAPFSATILKRYTNLGEMVNPAQKLLTLTVPEQSEAIVQLPIELVGKINNSESYFVFKDKKYPVSLRATMPSIETRARHQQLYFSFTDKDIPPINAFGELHFKQTDTYLPARLMVKRNNKNGIFLLIENKAVFLALADIKPGRPFKAKLSDDARIIVEGLENLQDDQVVRELSD